MSILISEAYTIQTCVNESLLNDLLFSGRTTRQQELLCTLSLQPVSHAVKHSRAMLYVDCVK